MFVNCSNIYVSYFDALIEEVLPELEKKLSSVQYRILVEDVLPMYRREIKTEPLMDEFMVENLVDEIVSRYDFI